jgi:ketosteroid isomerase-like protein
MSKENVDLVYRAYDAINRRDIDAHLAVMDDDVEGVPRAGLMEGTFRGHDGIRRWWENLLGVFPDFAIEVVEVRDLGGDLTIAALHVRGRGAGSDIPSDDTVWSVARMRRGKCVWWANFDTQAEALAAVGLPE